MDNQKVILYVVGVLVAGLLIGSAFSATGEAVRKNPNPGGGGCSDTDYGQNIFIKELVSSSQGSALDYCQSSQAVNEYYCYSKNAYTSQLTQCPNGYLCNDGACRIPPSTTSTTSTTIPVGFYPHLSTLKPNTVSLQPYYLNQTHLIFDVIINDVNTNVAHAPFNLHFDPNILLYKSYVKGTYLVGGSFLVSYQNSDPSTGTLFVGASTLGTSGCGLNASGKNWLMRFIFKRYVGVPGSTEITFSSNQLSNCTSINPIPGITWYGAKFVNG